MCEVLKFLWTAETRLLKVLQKMGFEAHQAAQRPRGLTLLRLALNSPCNKG